MTTRRFRVSRDTPSLYITAAAKDRLPVFQTDPIKAITCQGINQARQSCGFLLLAYVARTFIGAAAIVILGLVTLAALFVISRWLGFSTGIDVVSVAVPGFALFKLIDSLIFIGMSVPKLGWRAVLKP